MKPTTAVLLALLFSLAAILVAWGFQLIGGFEPCELCLKQRISYYIVVPLFLVLWLMLRSDTASGLARVGLVLAALIVLAGGAIGVYQAGAQWGFWPGPDSCSGSGLSGGLPNLATAKVIRCDVARIRILGLSFAGWNVVGSLVIAGLALFGARRPGQGSSSLSQ